MDQTDKVSTAGRPTTMGRRPTLEPLPSLMMPMYIIPVRRKPRASGRAGPCPAASTSANTV
jgi:hypothetical protein